MRPTRSERRVLVLLADGHWHRESELRTTWGLLHRLWLRGIVDGSALTFGATPQGRLWRLEEGHGGVARHRALLDGMPGM